MRIKEGELIKISKSRDIFNSMKRVANKIAYPPPSVAAEGFEELVWCLGRVVKL